MKEKYEVILNSPASDWNEGVPIGNGFLGSIVYGGPADLNFTINRSDVWDYRYKNPDPEGKLKFNELKKILKRGDEKKYKDFVKNVEEFYHKYPYPVPQTCGRIQLCFKADAGVYSQRLQPEKGKTEIKFSCNGKKRKVEAFIPPEVPVMFIRIIGKDLEPFYVLLNREGLSITANSIEAATSPKRIKIGYAGNRELFKMTGKFPDGFRFEVGVKGKDVMFASINIKEGKIKVNPGYRKEIILAVGVVAGYQQEKLTYELKVLIDNSLSKYKLLRAKHIKEWKRFWKQSSIKLPDKLLEHIWYISLYFLSSTLRYANKPPGLFGLWTYHDVPPWHGDYHLDRNLQAVLEALFSSNHPYLGDVYYDFFISILPQIREQTKKFYGWKGIAFPGTIGPKGENLGGYFPVAYWEGTSAWIALLFWWKYRFTMDKDFLREKVYPFLKECGVFYEKYLGKRKEDGKYHIWPSYLPETGANSIKAWGTDSAIDIALLKFLFKALINSADILKIDRKKRRKWKEILDNLADYPVWDGAIVDYKEWPELHQKEGIFTDDLRIAPVYPVGEINLDSPEEKLELGRRTFYSLEKHHVRKWLLTDAAAAARLGLSEWAYLYIKTVARNITPTGIGTYSSESVLNDGIRKLHLSFTSHNYAVFGIEFSANFVSAINEMLLQSCGRTIRIFPSIPSEWKNVSFENLRAEGAFLVSASMKNGIIKRVRVKSLKGEMLRIFNPWKSKKCYVKQSGKLIGIFTGEIIEINTQENSEYEFRG